MELGFPTNGKSIFDQSHKLMRIYAQGVAYIRVNRCVYTCEPMRIYANEEATGCT